MRGDSTSIKIHGYKLIVSKLATERLGRRLDEHIAATGTTFGFVERLAELAASDAWDALVSPVERTEASELQPKED